MGNRYTQGLFLVIALGAHGCGGDGTGPGGGGNGSGFRATIDGQAWEADPGGGGPGALIVTGTETETGGAVVRSINILLNNVTGPGTWNTAPVRFITAGRNTSTNCCWGLNAGGDVVTVTVTSITATRVKGTFSGTLQPHAGAPATAPLVVTDGVFDVGVD